MSVSRHPTPRRSTPPCVEAEDNGTPVVAQGIMPGGMRFAYLSAADAGVPYIEIAVIPAEIKEFFDYVKQEQQ